MAEDLVGRIAKEIAPGAFAGAFSSENARGAEQARARSLSRKVIAAMREPTEAMREAAMHADYRRGFHDDDYAETFQIMIDAALAESTPEGAL